jgi:hypothetical protein
VTAHRNRRRLAKAMAPPKVPKVTLHVGEIRSVTGSTAQIWLNGNSEVEVGPVPIAPGLTVAAPQIVEVTFVGQAPTITRRIT